MSGENFSHWFDINRERLFERFQKELKNGDTDSTFKEWTELEFELGLIAERVETTMED